MITKVASWCFRRKITVCCLWFIGSVFLVYASAQWGGAYGQGGELPGADSQNAYDLYTKNFPEDPIESATLVYHADDGVKAHEQEIDSIVKRLGHLDGVRSVESPFADTAQISADESTALAEINFDSNNLGVIEKINGVRDDIKGSALSVEVASFWFQPGDMPASEVIGILAAMIILLFAFGSVIAMGLPLVSALVGIAGGLATIQLWANLVETPSFTVQVASMIGLGVGIDYALVIVTRYRTARSAGKKNDDALSEAFSTAGRAVAGAGATVVLSLLGIFCMGLPFLYGLALGAASAVLIAVCAALTLLPALLGIVGDAIDRFSLHRSSMGMDTRGVKENVWHRWSRKVVRRPALFAGAGLAVLLVLILPASKMRLASTDLGNDPVRTTTRSAYDQIATAFGPGANGPLLLMVDNRQTDQPAVDDLMETLRKNKNVTFVFGPSPSPNGDVSVITIFSTTGPQDARTADLVHEIRKEIREQKDVTAFLGGQTAMDVDFSQIMAERLPFFVGAVLVVSFLLLLVMFQSVLVPLKAVVLNLLSIGAAYGVLVVVFQWGWGGGLLGIAPGPIEPWVPMMLFAVVFGMSMDYEVFLLSAIRERHLAGDTNTVAVVEGLATTARVISAAAAIMVCVFAGFLFGDIRAIKVVGLGLGVAVFLDATIVRMVMVPATMQLLGELNWWVPGFLQHRFAKKSVHQGAPQHVDANVSIRKGAV